MGLKTGEKIRKKKYDDTLLLWMIPLFCAVAVFCYGPLFGWIYAFFEYQPGKPLTETSFVGLKYFIAMFTSTKDAMNALKNTLVFSGLNILASPIAVIFAIALTEVRSKRFKKTVQTVSSLPNFISWVLVYSLAFVFFSREGFLNTILLELGIIERPIDVLSNSKVVYPFQLFLNLWKTVGWTAIIYIAAISGIDTELYEAAEIDGAGRWAKIVHVTIPGIMNTFVVMLLLAIGGIMNAGFEQYYVFSNPLITNEIEVLDTYVYKIGLGRGQYAFSVAVGMFKSVVSVVLLFAVNKLSKKARGESII